MTNEQVRDALALRVRFMRSRSKSLKDDAQRVFLEGTGLAAYRLLGRSEELDLVATQLDSFLLEMHE
jgi:hypothetical protein